MTNPTNLKKPVSLPAEALVQLIECGIGIVFAKLMVLIENLLLENGFLKDAPNLLKIIYEIFILFIVFLGILMIRKGVSNIYLHLNSNIIKTPPIGFSLGFFKVYREEGQVLASIKGRIIDIQIEDVDDDITPASSR